MKTVLNLTVAAALAAAALMAQTQGPGMPGTPNFDAVKAALTLSDAQITALTTIRQQEMQTIQPLAQQIGTRQQALRTLLANGTTAAVAGQALLEIEALRKQIEAVNTRFQGQAQSVLTADQRTKLRTLEDAAKLRQAIGQAAALNLLAPDTNQGVGPGGGRVDADLAASVSALDPAASAVILVRWPSKASRQIKWRLLGYPGSRRIE